MRTAVLLVLLMASAFGANVRLYLKDGEYHLVREYKVIDDRVRYYSIERGDWEEIPMTLVDLKRTESEVKERQAKVAEEAKLLSAEDKADREREAEIAKVPQGAGVYVVEGGVPKPMKVAESKVRTDKKRSVLSAISPIPMIAGKATVEIDAERASARLPAGRPEFYIRLSAEQRFGIVRLNAQKGVRIVEKVSIVPVTKEMIEEQDQVEIFRQQVDEGLYKIWPQKDLAPGEYAVVEYTEGKVNLQIWDFGIG